MIDPSNENSATHRFEAFDADKTVSGPLQALIIIDGNNDCYEGENFIGPKPISALVGAVDDKVQITVVFDASIRSLMQMDDRGIRNEIDHRAKINVAPTRTGADEYILNLARDEPRTFILSNDRFAEYRDYDAVRDRRVLRFLIANGRIMANDLHVEVEF